MILPELCGLFLPKPACMDTASFVDLDDTMLRYIYY